MKTKLLKKHIGLFLIFLFMGFSANAHVWEIRVNQNQDGTLTWYLQSYHSPQKEAVVLEVRVLSLMGHTITLQRYFQVA